MCNLVAKFMKFQMRPQNVSKMMVFVLLLCRMNSYNNQIWHEWSSNPLGNWCKPVFQYITWFSHNIAVNGKPKKATFPVKVPISKLFRSKTSYAELIKSGFQDNVPRIILSLTVLQIPIPDHS